MAPRSQEPQVKTEEKVNKYIATITFTVDEKDKATICYVFEGEKNMISQMASEQFKKDFPIDGVGITVNVAEVVDENLQKPTDEKKILKLIERYLKYQGNRGTNKKIKFMGKLISIDDIKAYYGLKEEKVEKVIEEPSTIKVPQMPSQEKVVEPVEFSKKSWFCEYNIKLGTEKFKKGTKIDDADNEIEARKQLDVYIKRTFSKIRSITKVTIKEWNGEEDYSEQIIEKVPVIKKIIEPIIEPKKQTIDEIIEENFSEEELNNRVIQVAVKAGKIKPKDFENSILIYSDEGQEDEDIFKEIKAVMPPVRRKYVGTKKVRFRQVLTTKLFKRILTSEDFKDMVTSGMSGYEAVLNIVRDNKNILKEDDFFGDAINSFIDKSYDSLIKMKKSS